MKRTTVIAWAIAGLVVAVPGAAAAGKGKGKDASACAGAALTPRDEPGRALASDAVLCLVNRERTSRGLGALRPSALLAAAATGHSADMVASKYVSHTGSNGSVVRQRIAQTGYLRSANGALFGETIAWGAGPYATPAQLVASFLASPEHRRTMLDKRFREVGVGLVLGVPIPNANGGDTATLDFGRR
jgi:uncharacterized protein YkwD